jgi:hypothetical protein
MSRLSLGFVTRIGILTSLFIPVSLSAADSEDVNIQFDYTEDCGCAPNSSTTIIGFTEGALTKDLRLTIEGERAVFFKVVVTVFFLGGHLHR